MPEDKTKADRKEKSDESYDLYDGDITGGGIVDNPSIHLYIAFQKMDTEDEGEQYDPSDFQASTIGGTGAGTTTPTDASSTGAGANGSNSNNGTQSFSTSSNKSLSTLKNMGINNVTVSTKKGTVKINNSYLRNMRTFR